MPSQTRIKATLTELFRFAPKANANTFLACLVLGHLAAYGMGPFYLWPALLVSLSVFWMIFTALTEHKKWTGFLAGFLFTFGFLVSSLWWVGNALLVGGNPYKWAYPLAVCGLPVLLSIFPTLFLGLSRYLITGRDIKSYLFFIVALFAGELARGTLLTGFPWNLFGMSWTGNLPMLQFLSIGGVYGLSALTIFLFTAPAFAWKGKAPKAVRMTIAATAALIAIATYGYGAARLADNPTTFNKEVVVQLIQPNIKQEDKWDSDKRWDNYRALISEVSPVDDWPDAKTRVLVLPESAITYHDLQTPQAMDAMHGRLGSYHEPNIYVLSGALLRDEVGYHNSLVVLDKDANFLESFDKFHLVPFGEYIPFQSYIPIPTITQFSGFVSGDGPHTLSQPGLPAFSPLVCYEVIFPGEVVSKTDKRPDWLVNVTNDAWYGISPGPFQHLAQAQYRAIEEGLPIARAANTGISALIDPYGRLVTASPLNQSANVEALLPNPAPETIYSRWH